MPPARPSVMKHSLSRNVISASLQVKIWVLMSRISFKQIKDDLVFNDS